MKKWKRDFLTLATSGYFTPSALICAMGPGLDDVSTSRHLKQNKFRSCNYVIADKKIFSSQHNIMRLVPLPHTLIDVQSSITI